VSENDPLPDRSGPVAQIRAFQSRAADLPGNVTMLPGAGPSEHVRILEAVLFAASEPLDEPSLADRLPQGVDIGGLLRELQAFYARRGVNLVQVAGKWTFRTADDLAFVMRREATETRRLSRAALETLAIIAYHQPTTRAEIEDVRGVAVSKGTLDVLMEAGWIRIRGRRQAPGRPVTFGTTDGFLHHFGLNSVTDLPGLDELKAVGLLRADPPDGFTAEELDEDDDDAEDEDICDQFDLDDLFAQDGEESAGGEPGDDEPGDDEPGDRRE